MKTNKILFTLTILLVGYSQAFAHYMWIETAEKGTMGQEHTVNVFFGEYTYGVIEDPAGEHFANVKNFDLWVVTPSGKKVALTATANKQSYQAAFTPEEKGTYTVLLNNNDIDVIDYTKYDFGIFKTHYHATAKVVVGEVALATIADNPNGLTVVNNTPDLSAQSNEVVLKVLFQGEPVDGQEVTVFVADLWSKRLKTDEYGQVEFSLPWKTKYTVETTRKQEVPGTFKGKDYEFIWHCATYCIAL